MLLLILGNSQYPFVSNTRINSGKFFLTATDCSSGLIRVSSSKFSSKPKFLCVYQSQRGLILKNLPYTRPSKPSWSHFLSPCWRQFLTLSRYSSPFQHWNHRDGYSALLYQVILMIWERNWLFTLATSFLLIMFNFYSYHLLLSVHI